MEKRIIYSSRKKEEGERRKAERMYRGTPLHYSQIPLSALHFRVSTSETHSTSLDCSAKWLFRKSGRVIVHPLSSLHQSERKLDKINT